MMKWRAEWVLWPPLLVEYLAGEAGLLTLIGTAIVAAVLLAREGGLSRQALRAARTA